MSCTSPSLPDDKEIDQVTDEVLQFLKEKHRVHEADERYTFMRESRAKERLLLRESIKDLLVGRNCDEF